MLFRCGMMTSLRQVRKPTIKNRVVATAIARVSVLMDGSALYPVVWLYPVLVCKLSLSESNSKYDTLSFYSSYLLRDKLSNSRSRCFDSHEQAETAGQ